MLRLVFFVFLILGSARLALGQYTGGINDGATVTYTCTIDLNGNNTFSLSAVGGSTEFCDFATEQYSVIISGASQNTTIVWTVPAGATVTSGQGTTSILVTFGNTNGNVRVDVTSPCTTIFSSLAVSSSACIFYNGGINDGFATATDCASNLNGGSTFIPGPIIGSTTFCDFATESYSIVVAGSTPETTYTWSVPVGATISSGQGTTAILVTFANTGGNVSVDVANACEIINVVLPVSTTSCIFYAGGDNDGFSTTTDCASNLNGGSTFIPGPIVGSTTFCDFATETYSITVAGATPETTYTWSVPVGATISSGQGTTTILVSFANTGGNVSVDVANACEIINVALAVSTTSCIFYAGGDNDGFSTTTDCASNLNGGSTFIPGPITGSITFCDFASEAYSIIVAGATSETTYVWSAPPGAVVTSGQGTTSVLVTFGNTAGNVSVAVSNPCETINVMLAVATTSCIFYAGGNGDGFAITTAVNIPLPIELIHFEAKVVNQIVKLKWITASELNNDFFTIEKSKDGESFEIVALLAGSGTSAIRKEYTAEDRSPFIGRSYYRLKQTDFDGTITYSHLVTVELLVERGGVVALYPNPVENYSMFTIEYDAGENETVTIIVYDMSGKVIQWKQQSTRPGNNTFMLQPQFESNGYYLVKVQGKNRIQTFKLLVQ